jgi:membrane-associated phospholipid phosphatase
MLKNAKSAVFFAFLALFLIVGCKNTEPTTEPVATAADYDHSVLSRWSDVFLQIERHAAGYRPGPAPRALAYIGLATYEATIGGLPTYRSLAPQYAGLSIPSPNPKQDYHWPSVVHGVHGFMLRRFFVTSDVQYKALIDALDSELTAQLKVQEDASIVDASIAYGQTVANAVWDWSKTDPIGHDAFLDPFSTYSWQANYQGDGDWAPTFPGPNKPMFPFWGKARTFAIQETDKLCKAPLPYGDAPTSPLFIQAMEVYSRSFANLSYDDKWIGEFWSDDLLDVTFSPGPRWIAVANQVYAIEQTDLATAIVSNAKIGMALNDAAVACWHSKYYYNVERPESYIQREIDPAFEPPLQHPYTGATGITPSFPAYPSGHSTMGAAAAEVLSTIFGYNYAMVDKCHFERTEFLGTPRSFGSFYEMAEENAISRIPLGVHFRMDCEEGVNLGYRCARRVNELPWQ